jgi:histidine triad (HIT) family protein
MVDCILCKVLSGEFDGSFVYRGETCSALLDISPMSKGHTLVVPNLHVARVSDLDPKLGEEMFSVATKISKAMYRWDPKMTAANLFLNDGSDAGQEIAHLHIHIVPRYPSDGIRFTHRAGETTERGELDLIAQQIANQL